LRCGYLDKSKLIAYVKGATRVLSNWKVLSNGSRSLWQEVSEKRFLEEQQAFFLSCWFFGNLFDFEKAMRALCCQLLGCINRSGKL
jgi:hypothetical protein